jgi:hypothetical protein
MTLLGLLYSLGGAGQLCHSGAPWIDAIDRLALFTCFDTVNSKWGTERTPPEVVMAMEPRRRTLYRAVNAVNKQ